MNPKDLTEECTESNSVSTTGTKTGCMKFYIFDDSGDTYKMILDHNTTAKIAYNTTTPYVSYENASIKITVDTDTTGWVGNPRIITADEIAKVISTKTFDGSSSTWFCLDTGVPDNSNYCAKSSGTSSYKWLFDYTGGCTSYGCDTEDSSTYGYWTSSPVSDYPNNAWGVYGRGFLSRSDVNTNTDTGIRPVITLSKSEFSS